MAAKRVIAKGLTSWEKLVSQGKATAPMNSSARQEWFLEDKGKKK